MKLSDFSTNYSTAQAARDEIAEIIAQTNASGRIAVEWVEGARGDTKLSLYRGAHLFVFPSQYPVEAQPLVLLEAMASGCAIITSTVGEIPFTMGEIGRLVEEISPVSVAESMAELVTDRGKITEQAALGLDRYRREFAVPAHIAHWERLLEG